MKSDLFLLVQNEINILILDSGNWENTNCPENRDTGLERSTNELVSQIMIALFYASKSMKMGWFYPVPWSIGLKCLRVGSKKTIYEVSSVNYL